MFKVKKTKGKARLGVLTTRRGKLPTPFFMPIATKGGIKAISVEDIKKLNPQNILSNTYHLMLRPGEAEIKKMGGLHRLMNWDKPILTDSGGFQVFSLAKIRKINRDGVKFRSHLDGREYTMTPEDSMRIQMSIGSDIMMVLDECVELPSDHSYLEKSIELTTYWAERCKKFVVQKTKRMAKKPLLFGIVQGGLEKDLRIKSANELQEIGFDGYAIGGLSVGESEQEMYSVLDYLCENMPSDAPRYLMGVGYPHQIVEAVKRGVDMFDCVIPTREARHGRLYSWNEKLRKKNIFTLDKDFYQTINIRAEKFKYDKTPIKKDSRFPELRNYTKGYLRHLFTVEDSTAQRLTTLNNLEFYLELMDRIRKSI